MTENPGQWSPSMGVPGPPTPLPLPPRRAPPLLRGHSAGVFEFCSCLVDLVVGVGHHRGGGHRLALVGERFVGPLAEDLAQVGARYETDFRESQMRSFSRHLHARRALASANR